MIKYVCMSCGLDSKEESIQNETVRGAVAVIASAPEKSATLGPRKGTLLNFDVLSREFRRRSSGGCQIHCRALLSKELEQAIAEKQRRQPVFGLDRRGGVCDKALNPF
jgi:hypothetical protein